MKLHKQKGVAAVELALIMVLMLVLGFGVVEVGRALYYYNGLVKATRSAARYLTQQDLNDPASAVYKNAVDTATSLAVCGKQQPACDVGETLVPGLGASKVTVTSTPYLSVATGQGSVSLVKVSIDGIIFQSFLPYTIVSFPFSKVTTTMAWSTS